MPCTTSATSSRPIPWENRQRTTISVAREPNSSAAAISRPSCQPSLQDSTRALMTAA